MPGRCFEIGFPRGPIGPKGVFFLVEISGQNTTRNPGKKSRKLKKGNYVFKGIVHERFK
jgi:hypothetical protein